MSNPGVLQNQVHLAEGWGQSRPEQRLELPSGSVILIRELEVEELIALGVMDKIDSFTNESLKEPGKKKRKTDEEDALSLLKNPKKLTSLMETVDVVVQKSIVRPEVHMKPPPIKNDEGEEVDAPLDPLKIYVHRIPMVDRMEVFQRAFKSMEAFFTFRPGQEAPLGDVAEGQGVRETTE